MFQEPEDDIFMDMIRVVGKKMKQVLKLLWVCGILMCINSCQVKDPKPLINEPIVGYSDKYDEAYGNDPLQRYDIHYPQSINATMSEVLILLHGGSWSGGDKSFLSPSVEMLKNEQKNLVIVNANYRLTGKTGIRLENQLKDIRLLLEHLQQKAAEYRLPTSGWVIGGISAGGHLALLHAYRNNSERLIKAVVGVVVPTDLTLKSLQEAGLAKSIYQLMGTSYEDAPRAYLEASPVYLIRHGMPKAILLYGGKDPLISSDQREAMRAKLMLFGVSHRYFYFPDEAHDFSPNLLVDKLLMAF
jgi:acetyl esterase/lipase